MPFNRVQPKHPYQSGEHIYLQGGVFISVILGQAFQSLITPKGNGGTQQYITR